jgi:hypothetical protein
MTWASGERGLGRTAALAAVGAAVMLLAACGGGSKNYAARPTADCLRSENGVRNVKLSSPESFESREGVLGAVEADIGRYTVDVVFFQNPKDLQREIAMVRRNEAISLGTTKAPQREKARRALASRDYVVRNARVRWRRGTVRPVSLRLQKTLADCLRH